MTLICGLEFKKNNQMAVLLLIFVMFFQVFLVLIAKNHYTIDIFFELMFSHYSFKIVNYWCKKFFKSQEIINNDSKKMLSNPSELIN